MTLLYFLTLVWIYNAACECPMDQPIVGYEDERIDVLFEITDLNCNDDPVTYTVSISGTGLKLVNYFCSTNIQSEFLNGAVATGHPQTGNISFKIDHVNTTFEGTYQLNRTQTLVKCVTVIIRALPPSPKFLNTDSDGNITCTEDRNVSIVCTSNGGYPKPYMALYRTNNMPHLLVENNSTIQRDDRKYLIEYTFQPRREDEGALFFCQISYDPPDPFFKRTDTYLVLNLKPSDPELTLQGNLVERQTTQYISNCKSDGFRPGSANMTIKVDGNNVVSTSTNTFNSSSGMYSIAAVYSDVVTRRYNGKSMQCIVNHTSLDQAKITTNALNILFKPVNISLQGKTSGVEADKGNNISLNCTSGSSNPKSNISWYINNQNFPNNATIHTNVGEYYGQVVSQTLQIGSNRTIDGYTIYCTTENTFSAESPVRSKEKRLDLVYHPIVTITRPAEVMERQTTEFKCFANAKPRPTFHWYHNSVLLSGLIEDSDNSSVLTLTSINRTHGGPYRCVAKNPYKPDGIQETMLTVLFNPLSADLIGITDGIVADGNNNIVLNCTSGSSYPKSVIKWYKNNILIQNDAQVMITNGEFYGNVTSQIYQFAALRNMDNDEFYCTVDNTIMVENPVMSTKKTLNLLYHPIAEISNGGEVIEGKQKTFQCQVESKPLSNISWYHNNSVLSGGQAFHGNTANYTIDSVHRTHAGWYQCRAENGFSPQGENRTYMIVNYAPDVEVSTTNVTVKNDSAVLNCKAFGVPDTYTFSEWQHIWPGHGIIKHMRSLGKNPNLTLTNLTYEYSGIYNCSVSNGIEGSLKPNAGYGTATLKVTTYPIITTIGIPKIPTRLNDNTTFTLEYYSNIEVNDIYCRRDNTTFNCSTSVSDGEVNLSVFGTVVRTAGQHANITLIIADMEHFGNFTIWIENSIGGAEKIVELVPEGPPEVPKMLEIESVTSHTATISWVPGFHGGFDQTFFIHCKKEFEDWQSAKTKNVTGKQLAERLNTTIRDLGEGTLYFIRISAGNILGNSNFTKEVNVTTRFVVSQAKVPGSSLPFIAGGVGGGILCIALIVIVTIFIRRRKNKGPPEVPKLVIIEKVTSRTATVSWVPGFHGEFDQIYLLEYRMSSEAWQSSKTVEVTGLKLEERISTTIRMLVEGTTYFIRIKSQNILGESNFTNELNFTTTFAVLQVEASGSSIPTIAGSVVGVVSFITVAVVIVIIFIRRHKNKNKDEPASATRHKRDGKKTENEYYNTVHLECRSENHLSTGRELYEGLCTTTDAEHAYGTLGQNVTYAGSSRVNTNVYENLPRSLQHSKTSYL